MIVIWLFSLGIQSGRIKNEIVRGLEGRILQMNAYFYFWIATSFSLMFLNLDFVDLE